MHEFVTALFFVLVQLGGKRRRVSMACPLGDVAWKLTTAEARMRLK
ncbi:MAG TPA: hypothetical protein PLY23_04655 [Alphaproteobacteria bacterium]|nr:hypothetical protein [Alphaproteobacteria bacterium]HQS93447.1 hypothetical protein [Alphaproteobacteria bacterium]